MKLTPFENPTRYITTICAVFLAASVGGCDRLGENSEGGSSEVGDGSVGGDIPGGADFVASATLGGTMNVANFTVPAGQTTLVTSDLTINATGNVVIDGELIADQNSTGPGYDISITSEGDMEITGSVLAGDGASPSESSIAARVGDEARVLQASGADGQDGGFLVLGAKNIRIRNTASIGSGDGGDGQDGTRGGKGGEGGLLILNGHSELDVTGSIHLGSGGNGGHAATSPENLQADDVFPNKGGDAGEFRIAWKSLIFPELQVDILTLYILDPVAYTNNETTGAFTGGIGGSAGGVLVSDLDSVSFDAPRALTTARASVQTRTKVLAQVLEPTDDQTVHGADGGAGWYFGGAGGEVNVTTPFTLRGGNGQSWVVFGGKGGDVGGDPDFLEGIREDDPVTVVAENATAGNGGPASLLVADGALGSSGAPNGGDGGDASALGGAGGNSLPLALGTGGHGGRAHAQSGSGGNGLEDDCHGGDGGKGGDALAIGGLGGNGEFPGEGGEAYVSGGFGGYGGDSSTGNVGLGGEGGAQDWRFGCDGVMELDPEREVTSCGPQSIAGEHALDGEDGIDLYCCNCPP